MVDDEYQASVGHDSEAVTAGGADIKSVADSNVSGVGLSMKARRILQIKRAEKELLKLQRRYEQVTDPQYLADLKLQLRNMEQERKEKVDHVHKLEIEQALLDKRIQKNAQSYESMFSISGAGQDKKTNLQVEVMAGIEITQRRIEAQTLEKDKLITDQSKIEAEAARESEKNQKLVQIAEKKYGMQLGKIDFYLPKGKDHDDKLRKLERKLVHQQREEIQQYRQENKTEDGKLTQIKRSAADTKEKIDLLKIRLKKQAMEAQKLVDKANETGDFKQAVELQEKNIKVFSLLNMSLDEVRGSKKLMRVKDSAESVRLSDK
jgi:hypothetical protein